VTGRVHVATSERSRVTTAATVGVLAGVAAAFVTVWQLSVLVGWIVTAVVLLGWVWLEIGWLDGEATARAATREDDSRAAARFVLVSGSVLSLLAIVAALHRAARAGFALEVALTAAALVSVAMSWLVVNTVFVLRYAHLYYETGVGEGVEFPGSDAPSYRDFAYLGFTVGMTFQVSDTAVTTGAIRATVLRQALLSYLFSIATIAFTINVVAGFVT